MADAINPRDLEIFKELEKAVRELKEELRGLAGTVVSNQQAISKYSKSQRDAKNNTDKLTAEEKQLESIRKRSEKVTLRTIKASEELNLKRRQLREEVRKQNKELQQNNTFTERLTKGFQNAILKVAGFIAVAKGAITAIQNITKNTIELNKQTTRTAQTFDISREEANKLTKEIRVLAAAYEQDFNDILKSSNILAQEFGITGSEALDLINQGFEKGANVNGEFLELLKEYPAQLKTVGLNAEQTIAIITQTERAGVFSDKGIDAIKEAGIRLRELTPATMAALNNIGLSGTEIQRQLESGEKTLFEVTQQVSQRLSELPEQSQAVGTAIADIFGGAGEDVGLRFLTTLKDIDLNLGNVDTTLSGLEQSQIELNKAWQTFKDSLSDGEGIISRLISGSLSELATQLNNITRILQGVDSALLEEFSNKYETLVDNITESKGAQEALLTIERIREKNLESINELEKERENANRRRTREIDKEISQRRILLQAQDRAIENVRSEIQAAEDANNKIVESDNKKTEKIKENLDNKYRWVQTTNGKILLSEQQLTEKLNRERAERADDFFSNLERENEEFTESIHSSITEGTENIIENEEKAALSRIEAAKKYYDFVKEAENDLKSQSIDTVNQLFDLRSSFRESEIASLEKQRDFEVSLAEERGESISAIENKFAKKEQELRTKQARQEKLQSIFNASITIAEGILKYSSNPATLPLVPFFAAIGAIQLGTIIATPIPEFKEGTKGKLGDSTLAKVSEAGIELGITKEGQMFLTPENESFMHLEKGTEIFPHHSKETQTVLKERDPQMNEMIKEQKLLRKSLNVPRDVVTREGARTIIEGVNSRTIIKRRLLN